MDNVANNLLFDKDYNLVGVVDWEWSRVVPAQLMVPPVWLTASQLEWVIITQNSYNKQVAYLRAAVQESERALGVPPRLSTEWESHETWYVHLRSRVSDNRLGCSSTIPRGLFHRLDD
jgi:thiamine kinase-like enzyme